MIVSEARGGWVVVARGLCGLGCYASGGGGGTEGDRGLTW